MCRNIKLLFNFEPPVTEDEVRAASLQYVRKISGLNKPSKANEAAFLAAVAIVVAVMGMTSARGATGVSQLKAAGTDTYAPMSLFRC